MKSKAQSSILEVRPDVQQCPVEFLRNAYLERKQKNPAYSLRAFARDLGVSDTLICLVFNGKRILTVKQASQMAVLLGLDKEQQDAFVQSTLLALPGNSKAQKKLRMLQQNAKPAQPLFVDYEVERFKLISQWFHLAILDLTDTQGFNPEPCWIASRLGISVQEVHSALGRLVSLGFLEKTDVTYKKVNKFFHLATHRSEPAVRTFHRQMMSKASEQLDKTSDADFALRNITSVTLSARKDRVEAAKKMIHEFQQKLTDYLSDGGSAECDEVYQINVQLFPLTAVKRSENT